MTQRFSLLPAPSYFLRATQRVLAGRWLFPVKSPRREISRNAPSLRLVDDGHWAFNWAVTPTLAPLIEIPVLLAASSPIPFPPSNSELSSLFFLNFLIVFFSPPTSDHHRARFHKDLRLPSNPFILSFFHSEVLVVAVSRWSTQRGPSVVLSPPRLRWRAWQPSVTLRP